MIDSLFPLFFFLLVSFLFFKRDRDKRILRTYSYLLNEKNQEDPSATANYDLFSDALYWSDEVSMDWPFELTSAMKVILRYRMSLSVGSPDVQYEKYWHFLKSHTPRWIGFSESRIAPSEEAIRIYWEGHQYMLDECRASDG